MAHLLSARLLHPVPEIPASQGSWVTEVLAHGNSPGSCKVPKVHTWDVATEISISSKSQTRLHVRVTWTACPGPLQSRALDSAVEIWVCGPALGLVIYALNKTLLEHVAFPPQCVVTKNFR